MNLTIKNVQACNKILFLNILWKTSHCSVYWKEWVKLTFRAVSVDELMKVAKVLGRN